MTAAKSVLAGTLVLALCVTLQAPAAMAGPADPGEPTVHAPPAPPPPPPEVRQWVKSLNTLQW